MTTIREHTLNWVLPSGRPGVTVLHYTTAQDGNAFNFAATAAGNALKAMMSTGTSVQTSGTYRDFEDSTGTLVAVGSYTPNTAVFGTSAVEPLPDAAAALIRWNTAVVMAGRQLRGRTFVSGLTTAAITDGNVNGTADSALNAFAQSLSSFRLIWHRPTPGGVGGSAPTTGHSVWGEYAVLRNRRTR